MKNIFENIINKSPETKPQRGEIEELKVNHLVEGVEPIRSVLVDSDILDQITKEELEKIKNDGEYIDWYQGQDYFHDNGIKNVSNIGEQTYTISGINEKDKFSTSYISCTGIVVVGVDKETNKNISFLSHQNCNSLFNNKNTFSVIGGKNREDYSDEFKRSLEEKLEDFITRSKPGTIDAVMFGGNYDKGNRDNYNKTIENVSRICNEKLGFNPVVLTGPQVADFYKARKLHEFATSGATNIYLDTENRRIYAVRPKPENNIADHEYTAEFAKKRAKKWRLES